MNNNINTKKQRKKVKVFTFTCAFLLLATVFLGGSYRISYFELGILACGAWIHAASGGSAASPETLNRRWGLDLPLDLEVVFFRNEVGGNIELRYSVFRIGASDPSESLKNFSSERCNYFESRVERRLPVNSTLRRYAPWVGWNIQYYWLHVNVLSWISQSTGELMQCNHSNLYAMFLPYTEHGSIFVFIQQIFSSR